MVVVVRTTRALHPPFASSFTEYALDTEDAAGAVLSRSWRRFRQFKNLRRRLLQLAPGAGLPELPPKVAFGSRSAGVVEQRCAELGEWATELLRSAPLSLRGELNAFLRIGEATPSLALAAAGRGGSGGGSVSGDADEHMQPMVVVNEECTRLSRDLMAQLAASGASEAQLRDVSSAWVQLFSATSYLAAEHTAEWQRALSAERSRSAAAEESLTAAVLQVSEARRQLLRDGGGGSAAGAAGSEPVLFASDDETEVLAPKAAREAAAAVGRLEAGIDDSDDDDEWHDAEDNLGASPAGSHGRRRKRLPHVAVNGAISIWRILKDLVGQDLSRITMPIVLNEPLSLLQRMCEDTEYWNLVEQAAALPDSKQRLLRIAAFAVSNYSTTENRTGKPFNPLLGETFEHTVPAGERGLERGYRFLAEQVRHHPPVSAIYAEALGGEGAKYWFDVSSKLKFTGTTVEVRPEGGCQLTLPASGWGGDGAGDHYTWRRVRSFVTNIIVGQMGMDHYGDLRVTNHTTGESCTVTFVERGIFDSRPEHTLEGDMLAAGGERVALSGRWSEGLWAQQAGGERELLWQRTPLPADALRNYRFTGFTVGLNQPPNEPSSPSYAQDVPRTDCTLRPDIRELENGDAARGAVLKNALEERQRAARKLRTESGREGQDQGWQPQWFDEVEDPVIGELAWKFRTGDRSYWQPEARAEIATDEDLDIFSVV